MSITVKNPPQRRRSLGPVSPKRIYRNLSVRLRGGDSPTDTEGSEGMRRQRNGTLPYKSLWEAVENEDTLAVQGLLSRDRLYAVEKGEKVRDWERERERSVNKVNEQGLVPLDVAALTHNSPLLQVLVRAGARHNPNLSRPAEWEVKLEALVSLAAQKVEEVKEELIVKAKAGIQAQADAQKQLRLWSHRQELYSKMRDTFHLTVPPGPPSSVSLLVTSESSLSVSIREPSSPGTGLITRYRVEWSSSESFHTLSGTACVCDARNPVFNITGLKMGLKYYVRVSAYNVKGWGPPQTASPACAAPSSWRQCSAVRVRCRNQEAAVRRLLEEIREPGYRGYCIESSRQLSPSKRLSVSRGFKQLFQSATKFVRLLQRGVYLAAVFYSKDNILVTADDQLPLVEIQCCSTSITQDFLWFAKLSCAWEQVPWLQQAMSSSLSSSSSLLQNRHSILRAVTQLQSSVGSEDLGQVYFEPLKDRQGNVLLVTLKEVATSASPPEPPLHWVPLSRLEKNRGRTPLLPEPTAMDTLTDQLREKLSYHRRSVQQAQSGLYVGILKLCSSVEQLRVLVPQRLPNLLCHARVRNNPHVSREEWTWLQMHATGSLVGRGQGVADGSGGGNEDLIDSLGLGEFVRSLRTAVTQLLTKLNIPLYRAYQYRVYTQELLQFGDQLSLLLLLPPSEEFSASYWPLEGAQDPSLTMPLQIFELVHFWAYARDFLSHYCQAWLRLELDAYLSQQALREALDSREVLEARERLTHITQLSQSLDSLWRESRWIMDVMQCVRSKRGTGAVPLGLVMGAEQPVRPHTEEEQGKGEDLSRLWPSRLHKQRTISAESYADDPVSSVSSTPVDIPGTSDDLTPTPEPLREPDNAADIFPILQTVEPPFSCPPAAYGNTETCYYDNGLPHGNGVIQAQLCSEATPLFPSIPEGRAEEQADFVDGIMEAWDRLDLQTLDGMKELDSGLQFSPFITDCPVSISDGTAGLCLDQNISAGAGLWDFDGPSEGQASTRPSAGVSWPLPRETSVSGTGSTGRGLPVRSLVEWVSSSANQEC